MHGTHVTVRLANREDEDCVHALLLHSGDDVIDSASSRYLRTALGPPLSDPETARKLLSGDGWAVILGAFSEVDCGIAVAHRSQWENGGKVLTVPWIYVDREFRRCGVGEAMVAELGSLLSAEGGGALDVLTAPGDRALKSLLEVSGLSARAIVMSRAIERRPDPDGRE
jgi:hypothetical protein